jgi:flagellar biosynthesis protein FliR
MGSLFDPSGLIDHLNPVLITFAMVLTRVIGLFVSAPFYSLPQVPAQIKAILTCLIALLIMGPLGIHYDLVGLHFLQYVGLIICEFSIGLCIGLLLMLIFSGIEFAGRLFGIQMGLAVANVVDPTTSQQIGVLSQFIRFIFLFTFFAIDGHLMLLKALMQSFEILPLGRGHVNFLAISDDIIAVGSDLFKIAMRIALPISCVVLLINTGLAALARTTPQMNIFMVGFMLNIGAGLIMLGLAIPSLIPMFRKIILQSFEILGTMLQKM